ncbi:dTDP-4-dehydrorhamnose reductase [Dactylosporangium sp. NPDC051485]|uniref:dTDP-4-dehydrorhamnose reductase n=1 Tax=Dactylosporangium sp. NPDC051485 TaxID=3154846 RepID=UPI003428F83B
MTHRRRWAVTGAAGMLGQSLVEALSGRTDVLLTALDRAALDITDPAAAREALRGHDVVVNAAAYTDVDGAEAHEEQATAVNGHAVGVLAAAAGDAVLLQVSTDYVFDGRAREPYPEDAATAPVNAYGRGKLAGERLVPAHGYAVRTAWLYADHGRNFVRTMLTLAADRPHVSVVTDQLGQPTSTTALARQLVLLGMAALDGTAPPGVYHATAAGSASWNDLAAEAYAAIGLDPDRVRPARAADFPRPAVRPAYSVLGHDRWHLAGLAPPPSWREQLHEELARPGFAEVIAAAGGRPPRPRNTGGARSAPRI